MSLKPLALRGDAVRRFPPGGRNADSCLFFRPGRGYIPRPPRGRRTVGRVRSSHPRVHSPALCEWTHGSKQRILPTGCDPRSLYAKSRMFLYAFPFACNGFFVRTESFRPFWLSQSLASGLKAVPSMTGSRILHKQQVFAVRRWQKRMALLVTQHEYADEGGHLADRSLALPDRTQG